MGGNAVVHLVIFGLYIFHSCCYQVPIIIEESKTWKEAQSFCRENYDDLITINSVEEATVLGDILRNSDEQFWIGLYGNFYNFVWSMVPEGFDEGQDEYTNWYVRQPNEDKNALICVTIDTFGKWSDTTCWHNLPTVCYDSSENRYILVTETMDWISAQMYCRKHHTDLATIRNESENNAVTSIVQTVSWIGYHRLSWMWSDGQPRHVNSFNNWGTAEPARVRNYCANTRYGKWTEKPCSYKHHFICSRTMKKHMRIKVVLTKWDSSMNLEETQDAILHQFIETMKKHQISEQVSLKWIEQPDGKIYQKTKKQEKKGKQDLHCR